MSRLDLALKEIDDDFARQAITWSERDELKAQARAEAKAKRDATAFVSAARRGRS